MKKTVFTVLVLISVLFSACRKTVLVEDIRGSRLESLNSEDNKDNILIIDSRPYEAYKKEHLPNAISIPTDEIYSRVEEFADWKKKPIFVYGMNNDDSFKACEKLVQKGCKEVYNAEGLYQYKYKTVSFDFVRGITFTKMLKDKNSVVIDCRSKSAYDLGHIEGAISVPMTAVGDNLHRFSKNQKLLFYCNAGTAAARAAAELSALGYTDIYCSVDGIKEYDFKLVQTEAKGKK